MKCLKYSLIILLSFIGSQFTNAQKYSFEDLVDFTLLDSGPITSKNEIQGYYLFFEKDRVSKDSSEFVIKILDQNLNELTNKELTGAPNTFIEALVFNGQSILLKQFEQDNKELKFKVQSMKVSGELTLEGEQMIKIDKHSKSSVYAVQDKGFANIYGTDKRKAIIEFYDKNGKSWTYKTPEDVKWEEVDYVTTYDDVLLFSVYRYNKVTQGGDYFLTAFNEDSGEIVYEQVLTDFGYDHEIAKGFINPIHEELWISGDYYDKGEDEEPENSNGLFIMKISKEGEILDTDYAPWDGKINRYAKQYKKGKLKDGFIYMHDFVFLKSGEVFGVGEQYRKAFRVLGLAEAALTVGLAGRLSKVFIGDLLTFQFGTNAKLVNTERLRKPSKKELPNKGLYGGILIPGKKIGDVMDEQGAFDFSHVAVDNDNESFTVFYYMKEELSKKQIKRYKRQPRYILRTLTYKDREWSKDRFYLSDGKAEGETKISIMPAKPGYVLVSEQSEEYTGLRLEKIK